MEFVQAKIGDYLILGEMNKRLIQDEGHANPMTVAQLQERMKRWLESDYSAYLFLSDGQIAGYCLYRDEADFVYIRHLYVERGLRRRGLGRACIGWLREHVWMSRTLRMEVLSSNEVGVKFWRGIGFKDYAITMELK